MCQRGVAINHSSIYHSTGFPGCVTYILNNAPSFTSNEFKNYLIGRGVATSHNLIYNPTGNSQVERFNGVISRAMRLVLKTRNLPTSQRESVLPEVIHFQRSLLCTTTNATPHQLFFQFNRKSMFGY